MANTTAPLSEVAIANFAATMLDERHLASLDQETTLARFIAAEFGYIRDEMLRAYPWAFAVKRAALAEDPDNRPAFGWRYAYRLPTDRLRLLPIRRGGVPNGALIPYELEGSHILTNECAPLYIRYIRRVTNPAEFDPLFARALGSQIALHAAHRVTGKATFVDKVMAVLAQQLADARLVDSQERGTTESVSPMADVFAARGDPLFEQPIW